jgi:hypothetical protein
LLCQVFTLLPKHFACHAQPSDTNSSCILLVSDHGTKTFGGAMASEFLDMDPRKLHLPPSRASGPDPGKLAYQTATHGSKIDGMPALWVYRGSDGAFMIYDGVTRASRVAILLPGTLVHVEVVGNLPAPCGQLPTIGDYAR